MNAIDKNIRDRLKWHRQDGSPSKLNSPKGVVKYLSELASQPNDEFETTLKRIPWDSDALIETRQLIESGKLRRIINK